LVGVPDNASVVFQANEPGEEDKAGEATCKHHRIK
jgi:hypothetical protein